MPGWIYTVNERLLLWFHSVSRAYLQGERSELHLRFTQEIITLCMRLNVTLYSLVAHPTKCVLLQPTHTSRMELP